MSLLFSVEPVSAMGFEAAPAAEERTGARGASAALAAGVAWHPAPSARSMEPTTERTATSDFVFVFGVFMTGKMQRPLDPR